MNDATGAAFAGRTGMTAFLLPLRCCASLPRPQPRTTPLDAYLADLKTLRAEFSQQVTDGRGGEVQQARTARS